MATVINRGNGHWELRVYIGQDKDGNKIRKSKRIVAKSKRAAMKELDKFRLQLQAKELQAEEVAAPVHKDMAITFDTFVGIWDKRHNIHLAMTTREHNRALLRNRILPFFHDKPIENINVEDIRAFIYELHQSEIHHNSRQKQRFLSETMIHKNFALLKHILSKAVEWGYIKENPCDRLEHREIPKPNYHHYPIIQEEQLKKLLKAIDALPDNYSELKHRAIFYLTLMTGMRKGEVSALRWSDIDWDEKKICIQRSVKYVSSRCTEVSNPKTDKSIRTVYISDFLSQLLEQLKRKQIKYLESKGYINEDNYVFLAVRRRHDCLVCRLCFHVGCRLCRLRRGRSLCPQFSAHALQKIKPFWQIGNKNV